MPNGGKRAIVSVAIITWLWMCLAATDSCCSLTFFTQWLQTLLSRPPTFSLNQDHGPTDTDKHPEPAAQEGQASPMGVRWPCVGPLQLFCLQKLGTLDSSHHAFP